MIYWLSATDEVIRTAGPWDRFAAENGGPGAVEEMVLGRPLWDFVQGVPTRRFLEGVFHACRHGEDGLALPYRCDGNGEERLICLRVLPEGKGVLQVRHDILRLRPAFAGLLPKAVEVAGYHQCSICMRCHLGQHWISHGRLIRTARTEVTYVVCPACRAAAARMMVPDAPDGPLFA